MAMQEQENCSPPPETARTASDEPQLPGLDSIAGGSAATMATGDMVGDGGAGEEEQGPEGSPDNIRSSSPRVALLSVMGGLKPRSSHIFAYPEFQRKPRSHVPRAVASHPWGFKHGPILPPAPELEQPRPQEIQDPESSPPDSPILESITDVDVYLLRRTSPRREKSPPPPPPPPPPPTADHALVAAAAPALGNEIDTPEKWCLHCGITLTLQWRTGPLGESTLCNACGVRYRQGRLLPEYRPRASPTFNQSKHSYKHSEVLKIREKHAHPAPPVAIKLIKARKRRKGKGQQQQPAQVCKKRKGNKAQNQAAQAQPAPAATQQRSGNDMLQNLPPPPPPPTAEPPPAVAAPAPGDEKDTPEKWCLHCGITSTLRWRTGPLGESTLCNACGVRYRQGRLVPEYRPRASPTFNQSEHSYQHREVLEIRKKQDHPAPQAAFKFMRTRKRRKGTMRSSQ